MRVKREERKAQVTLFMVIGVAVLIAIYLIVVFSISHKNQNQEIQTMVFDFQETKDYINSCIQENALEGAMEIGQKGGYYNLPELSTKEFVLDTAYHIYNDQYLVPTQSHVESQYASYLNDNLDECVSMVNEVQKDVIVEKAGNPSSQVALQDTMVDISVNFPLNMKKKDIVHKEENFAVKLPKLRLKNMLSASNEIAENQMENQSMICISCLSDIGTRYNFTIDFMRKDNGAVFYQIIDDNFLVQNESLMFVFAHKNIA